MADLQELKRRDSIEMVTTSHVRSADGVRHYCAGCGAIGCVETVPHRTVLTDEMIERGAAEIRAAMRQLEDGRIEAIQVGSLAEDVLRAALDAPDER